MNDPPLLRSEYLLHSEDIRSFRIELEGLEIDILKKILRNAVTRSNVPALIPESVE